MIQYFFTTGSPKCLPDNGSERRYWLVGEGRMRGQILKMAEAWAHMAGLQEVSLRSHMPTEEALTWCIFYLWAAEEV